MGKVTAGTFCGPLPRVKGSASPPKTHESVP